jgi:hypothetical protein
MLFNFIYNCFALTGVVWILNDIGNMYMPTITHKIRHYVLWQGLKVYTLLENRFHLCVKKCKVLLDNYFHVNSTKENVHFIHNGIVVKSSYSNECLALCDATAPVCVAQATIPVCDFIMQFIKVRDDTLNNHKFDYDVIRFNTYKELVEFNTINKCVYTPSPVKFIGMSIVISNVSNQIDLDINSGKFNFFINSNILFDRPFIQFYLKKFHDIILKEEEDYTFSFIDSEIEVNQIKDDHYVELCNNNYKICFVRS